MQSSVDKQTHERLRWTAQSLTGNAVIDQQHRQIIDLIERLIEIEEPQESKAVIADTLDQLMRYTKEHLLYEERLLEANSYPDLEAHKAAHREFRKQVTQFCREAASSKPGILREVLVYLVEWWTHHIQQDDKAIAGFLDGKV